MTPDGPVTSSGPQERLALDPEPRGSESFSQEPSGDRNQLRGCTYVRWGLQKPEIARLHMGCPQKPPGRQAGDGRDTEAQGNSIGPPSHSGSQQRLHRVRDPSPKWREPGLDHSTTVPSNRTSPGKCQHGKNPSHKGTPSPVPSQQAHWTSSASQPRARSLNRNPKNKERNRSPSLLCLSLCTPVPLWEDFCDHCWKRQLSCFDEVFRPHLLCPISFRPKTYYVIYPR